MQNLKEKQLVITSKHSPTVSCHLLIREDGTIGVVKNQGMEIIISSQVIISEDVDCTKEVAHVNDQR